MTHSVPTRRSSDLIAAEQERLKREAEAAEAARRKAAMDAAMAAEQQGRIQAAQADWGQVMAARIRKFWIRPPASPDDFACTVAMQLAPDRSEERRVGKEWVRTCRSRRSAYH